MTSARTSAQRDGVQSGVSVTTFCRAAIATCGLCWRSAIEPVSHSLAASFLGVANGSAVPTCRSGGPLGAAVPPPLAEAAPPAVRRQPSQPAPSAAASSVA